MCSLNHLASLDDEQLTYEASLKTRPGFVDGIPSAVLRFAVRRVVDEDEVQIAWGVEWHPEVLNAVPSMDDDTAARLIKIADRLPACSVIMVQGLSELNSNQFNDAAEGGSNSVSPAITAAMFCAMRHVMVTEDFLPIHHKKTSVNFPTRRLPPGWTIEVDINDIERIATYCEGDAAAIRDNPAIPYGRFLWVALDGQTDLISCTDSAAMRRLKTDAPSTVVRSVCIQARKNHALVVKSPAGPLAITRHAIERTAQRMVPRQTPAKAASWLANTLYSGALYDVTKVVSEYKNRKLNRRLRILAKPETSRLLIFVISIDRSGDYLATSYVATEWMDAVVRPELKSLPVLQH